MKQGDLVRNVKILHDPSPSWDGWGEDWMGTVLSVRETEKNLELNHFHTRLEVLLTDGRVKSSWFSKRELKKYIEVIP
jgi:hypothetical protein